MTSFCTSASLINHWKLIFLLLFIFYLFIQNQDSSLDYNLPGDVDLRLEYDLFELSVPRRGLPVPAPATVRVLDDPKRAKF